MGSPTHRKKWQIFYGSLEEDAKVTVQSIMQRHEWTAHLVSGWAESEIEGVMKYMIQELELSVNLTAARKGEVALQNYDTVRMAPGSGATGAEKFLRDYRRAHLAEMKSGLTGDWEDAATRQKRLYDYKNRLAPEVKRYLLSLTAPPTDVPGLHEAVRRWAEMERMSEEGPGVRREPVREHQWALEEAPGGRGAPDVRQRTPGTQAPYGMGWHPDAGGSASSAGGAVPFSGLQPLIDAFTAASGRQVQELIAAVERGQQVSAGAFSGHAQALGYSPGPAGGRDGGGSDQGANLASKPCHICGGLHLARLRGRGCCPNEVAEAMGTSEANKRKGAKCTMWINDKKEPCGGSHTWEDHKAALEKHDLRPLDARKPKGGGKGEGRGKGQGGGKGDGICFSWAEKGSCRFGDKCRFKHEGA